MDDRKTITVRFRKQDRLWHTEGDGIVLGLAHTSPAVLASEVILAIEDSYRGQLIDLHLEIPLNRDEEPVS